jgi:hypothetical protein
VSSAEVRTDTERRNAERRDPARSNSMFQLIEPSNQDL